MRDLVMTNDYEVRGEMVVLFLNRRDGSRIETLVDIADLPRIQAFPGKWRAKWDRSARAFYVQGIATRKYSEMGRKMVYLSRFIMNAPVDLEVDHINHNPLDNRRCNLRLVDKSGNAQNRRGANRNGKTGIRGVSWHKEMGKWMASIRVHGKQHRIGYFDNLEEAARAVEAARAKYMPYSPDAEHHKEG